MLENTIKTNFNIGEITFLGVMKITPKIAEEMLKNNNVNRALNRERVNTYAYDMINGKWGGGADGLMLQFDKNENLLNGQHRLNAIIKSGKSIDFFIFQSNVATNALNLSIDIGAKRSLSLITSKDSRYTGTIAGFVVGGTPYQRCSVQMLINFENSLTEEELNFFTFVSKCRNHGHSVGLKVGFLLYYFYHKDKCDYLRNVWTSLISSDYNDPVANQLRDYINKNIIGIGGSSAIRMRHTVEVYGILEGVSPRAYKSNGWKATVVSKLRNFMKLRMV